MQYATTTTDHDVHPALPERRAPTVADTAPALARGPRPLPSPEAVGGGARSRPLTLCGSLRSDLARRCWCHRRRGPPGLLVTLPGQIGRCPRLRRPISTTTDGGDARGRRTRPRSASPASSGRSSVGPASARTAATSGPLGIVLWSPRLTRALTGVHDDCAQPPTRRGCGAHASASGNRPRSSHYWRQ